MATPVKERVFESDVKPALPRPFILRRLHSLLGLGLVIYLFEHLLVNSQAALFFRDDGAGFISSVNHIHHIPYLPFVEAAILGVPFFIHGIWGIKYALTSKGNAHKTDGSSPGLPQYKRNKAYSWQRITSWLLLVGIAAHVVHMRFILYPGRALHDENYFYMVPLAPDRGLDRVADKLEVQLLSHDQLQEGKHPEWLHDYLQKKPVKTGYVLAVASNPGAAFFLIVRETFKSPWMVCLYSVLVIASAYHAFNGLWTLMITWGVTITRLSQRRMRTITNALMGLVTFLGLMAAWGTFLTIQIQG